MDTSSAHSNGELLFIEVEFLDGELTGIAHNNNLNLIVSEF